MAIRVKKLARELRASPQVILLALSDLGYDRYKSPMDMVADRPADKVRTLARKRGLPSLPAASRTAPDRPSPPPARSAPRPTNASPRPTNAPPRPTKAEARPKPPPRAATPAPSPPGPAPDPLDIPLEALVAGTSPPASTPDLDRLNAEIQAEERRLQARGHALAERTRALEARHAEIEAERAAVERERDRLEQERARLHQEVEALRARLAERAATLEAMEAGGVPLGRLFEERGLRGRDEQSRALAALARERLLDRVLERLRVLDPAPVRALLKERLVLAASELTGLDGVAVVQVASDRSEAPSAANLDRFRADLAGEFLLAGLRRARLIGGGHAPALLRLLRDDLDPRVDIQVTPARRRDAPEVPSDVADMDVVVLWGVLETEQARAAYDAQPVPVVRLPAEGGLPALLAGVREALLDL